MNIPPFLKPGDTIGICAPARKISPAELEPAINEFKSWGLHVRLSENIFKEYHQFSGTDQQRAHDLQELVNSPEINAIMCARGGYGTVRIIDSINFSPLLKFPKWICGFSDITVLHAHINKNFQLATLHSVMPINFNKNVEAVLSLKNLLFGEEYNYPITPNELNKDGEARGEIIGGNLSVLYSIANTPSDIDTNGKILFIEDLDEYLYHIDRMMMQLKRSGKLENLAGLLVGAFTDIKDNTTPFGKNAYQIIREHVDEYQYPVCFGFPAGHQDLNLALYFGIDARMIVSKNQVKLTFPHLVC